MLELTDENFEEEIEKENQVAFVDFWMPGCGPCLVMEPAIEEIAEEFKNKIKVGKLNIFGNPETAKKYKIMGVPTFIIFKEGKPAERATGVRPKEILINKINSLVQKK